MCLSFTYLSMYFMEIEGTREVKPVDENITIEGFDKEDMAVVYTILPNFL